MLHHLHNRREQIRSVAVAGSLVPVLKIKPRKSRSKKEIDAAKEQAAADSNALSRVLFRLGVSLIDVNVESCNDTPGTMNIFNVVPALRHIKYASVMADGAADFLAGIIYGFYTQTKEMYVAASEGDASHAEVVGSVAGLYLQSGVYLLYYIFVVPVVFTKLTTMKK